MPGSTEEEVNKRSDSCRPVMTSLESKDPGFGVPGGVAVDRETADGHVVEG